MVKKLGQKDWIRILVPALVALGFTYFVSSSVTLAAVAFASIAALEAVLTLFLE